MYKITVTKMHQPVEGVPEWRLQQEIYAQVVESINLVRVINSVNQESEKVPVRELVK